MRKTGMLTFVDSDDLCAKDRCQVVIVLFREAQLFIREIGEFFAEKRGLEVWAFSYNENDPDVCRFMEQVQAIGLAREAIYDVQLDQEAKQS